MFLEFYYQVMVFLLGEKNNSDSVMNAELIEYIAEMALYTKIIRSNKKIPKYLKEKHFFRKHGLDSYYGQ